VGWRRGVGHADGGEPAVVQGADHPAEAAGVGPGAMDEHDRRSLSGHARRRSFVDGLPDAATVPRRAYAAKASEPPWCGCHRLLSGWRSGRTLLTHVRDDRLYAAWMLFATTGIRRGEIAGLRWVDVALAAVRVTPRKPGVEVNYKVHVSEPKTAKGQAVTGTRPRDRSGAPGAPSPPGRGAADRRPRLAGLRTRVHLGRRPPTPRRQIVDNAPSGARSEGRREARTRCSGVGDRRDLNPRPSGPQPYQERSG
jgi:hypothetical protein